jgi:hypothetical protein
MLQMNPVTLTTIQKSLKPDQALVQLFIRDSLCTALLISNREMQIVSNPVPSSQLNAGLANLRNTLERAGVASAQTMVKNRDRVWLNNVLLHSMSEKLSRYEHLIFISDTPIPLHLMGDDRFLGREKKLSMLYSAREAVLSAPSSPGKDKVPSIVFFNASAIADARIYKMLHGEDKVFLLWKNMTKDQLDELKILMELYFKREKSGSGFLNSLASGTGDLTGDQWLYLSSYGFD